MDGWIKFLWSAILYCLLAWGGFSFVIFVEFRVSIDSLSNCGHGTKAIIQTHKSVNEWRIRMFRPTYMDPRIKGVVRRPRIVSITW